MEVTDHACFPTRVVTIQFENTEPVNAELCELFENRPELDDRSNLHPDAQNLLCLAETVPAIAQLRRGSSPGETLVEFRGDREPRRDRVAAVQQPFRPGEATIAHNHQTDLIGIYYARTAESTRPPIDPVGGEDYFEPGDGVLLLHDPRFNANLTTVCQRDHVRVHPRRG